MQDHPGVPGSARQGNTGTDVPAACGGAAGQSKAPDHTRSRAAPMPKAPDHNRSGAAPMPKVSDHNRSHAAPQVPDHDRSCTAPMPKALGHNRPHAASMASPGHAARGPASAGPSVPITTALRPARVNRLLQVVLLRVAATPRTLIYPQSRPNAAKSRAAYSQAPPQPQSRSATYSVHPATLVPPRPPPATAGTGCPRHSRAPPLAARRKSMLVSRPAPLLGRLCSRRAHRDL